MTKQIQAAVQRAIEHKGSQAALGAAIKRSQRWISKLARGEAVPSAEDAIKMEKATDGAIGRAHLRPDIFGAAE